MAETQGSQVRGAEHAGPHSFLRIHVWAPGFEGFGGGIATFSRELVSGIAECGHDLTLFGKADIPGTFAGHPLWGSVGPQAMRTFSFASRCLRSAVRQRPARIVSTHVNFGRVAHMAKRASKTPYTLVAHGIDIHRDLPRSTIAALRAADRIVAVSSWTRQRVLDLGGIDESRIAILPNTFDDARFGVAERSAELLERYRIASHERVIVSVARLASSERYKGYDRIIRALPSLQKSSGPVRFVIAGDGDDLDRVKQLAREVGVLDKVIFAGFVPDKELADHYRLADVFAMPSTGEGFGIVFLEAMGCGTPVVAGNRDGSVDALDSGRLGQLVDPIDVDSIAAGIAAVLRRSGPPFWFDRVELSRAVVEKYGRVAFRSKVSDALALS